MQRISSLRHLIAPLALAGAWVGAPLRGEDSPAPAALIDAGVAAAASPEVEKLVRELEEGDFKTRMEAEEKLYLQGARSVAELKKAAERGSAETSSRVVRILRRIYLTGDEAVTEKASEALESLAQAARVSSAEMALQTIEGEREQRAINTIRDLGAMVRMDPTGDGDVIPVIDQVRLDENWKGGNDGLKYFTRISSRQKFMVTVVDGSNVTEEAIQKVQTDLPSIQIQMRGSATLGIGPDSFPDRSGCIIGRVLPDNAAYKAGLLIGDRVEQIDGTDVETFDDLVGYLRKKKVGDEVKLSIDRDGEKKELTAKLQSWKSIDNALPADGPAPRFFAPPRPLPVPAPPPP
jgi:hypothetical protein